MLILLKKNANHFVILISLQHNWSRRQIQNFEIPCAGMLLGQIWYHLKGEYLLTTNPVETKFGRWAVAMETASKVQ